MHVNLLRLFVCRHPPCPQTQHAAAIKALEQARGALQSLQADFEAEKQVTADGRKYIADLEARLAEAQAAKAATEAKLRASEGQVRSASCGTVCRSSQSLHV